MLVPSEELPQDAPTIRGYDFNEGRDLDGLLESMLRTGLQATALGQAINEVNRMVRPRWPASLLAHWLACTPALACELRSAADVSGAATEAAQGHAAAAGAWATTLGSTSYCPASYCPASYCPRPPAHPQIRWRLADEPLLAPEDEQHPEPAQRAATRCKIFLGYTSNLVSAGVREHIRYLVQVRASGWACGWGCTGCMEHEQRRGVWAGTWGCLRAEGEGGWGACRLRTGVAEKWEAAPPLPCHAAPHGGCECELQPSCSPPVRSTAWWTSS